MMGSPGLRVASQLSSHGRRILREPVVLVRSKQQYSTQRFQCLQLRSNLKSTVIPKPRFSIVLAAFPRAVFSPRYASSQPSRPSPLSSTDVLPIPQNASLPQPTPQTEAPEVTSTSLTDILGDDSRWDFTTIPIKEDHIGALREMGVDFGYGLTTSLQWAFEAIHLYTPLPWWAIIIIPTIMIRIVFFKWFREANETSIRIRALTDVLTPLNKQMKNSALDRGAKQQVARQINDVYKDAGISRFSAFKPAILQVVAGFCTFRLLRGMATVPVPSLQHGGFAWFQDFSVADPYFVLPLVTATTIWYGAYQSQLMSGPSTITPGAQKFVMYGLPTITFVFTSYMASCLSWMILAGSSAQVVMNTLLLSPRFRRWKGMIPLVQPPKVPPQSKPSYGAVIAKNVAATEPRSWKKPMTMVRGAMSFVKNANTGFREQVQASHARYTKGTHPTKPKSQTAKEEAYEKRRAAEEAKRVSSYNERQRLKQRQRHH
ncbi:MAG: Mitochondrial inner membrane protein oxa1 [Vezdaea aestivalis]|nr:MAG: Mitochondrial inner membrane protein oxa1 [Vezdaea aestivalis]